MKNMVLTTLLTVTFLFCLGLGLVFGPYIDLWTKIIITFWSSFIVLYYWHDNRNRAAVLSAILYACSLSFFFIGMWAG